MPDNVLDRFLSRHENVEFIRFQFVDFGGVVRCKMATIKRARRMFQEGANLSAPRNVLANFYWDGQVNVDALVAGKDELLPDWFGIRECTYAPTCAVVMCSVSDQVSELLACPRSSLEDVQRDADELHGIRLKAGFEIEFVMLDYYASENVPVTSGGYTTNGLRNAYYPVVEESVRLIEAAGIDVWNFHAETDESHFEISLSPNTPLKAADDYVYAVEVIKSVAVKHDLHATFFPTIYTDSGKRLICSGQHAHISIEPADHAEHFLAGMLKHMPAIAAFTLPNLASFDRRLRYGGEEYVTWGKEHRIAVVREIDPGHWEMRAFDACANPYLGLLSVLAPGMKGLAEKEELNIEARWSDNVLLKQEEVEALGLTQKMPQNLAEALKALEEDGELQEMLGDAICKPYLQYKKKELGITTESLQQDSRRWHERARLTY